MWARLCAECAGPHGPDVLCKFFHHLLGRYKNTWTIQFLSISHSDAPDPFWGINAEYVPHCCCCCFFVCATIFQPVLFTEVTSQSTGSGQAETVSRKISCLLYERWRADWLVRDRLCSASLISWLASSREGATEVCPIKLSPVFKRPCSPWAEAAFMTQNRGDEPGPLPGPPARIFCLNISRRARRCKVAPGDADTCVTGCVCKQYVGWQKTLLNFTPAVTVFGQGRREQSQ